MTRKTTSLILLLSGIPVIVTSIVLFLGPPTHVAHFSDWRVQRLTKCQWNALHITTGSLFMVAMLLHTYFNHKAIVAYLKDKASTTVVFARPFAVALALTTYVCLGSLLRLPPVNQFLGLVKAIRIAHVQRYGSPPYGQAESYPLQSIAAYLCWDAEECLSTLRAKGITVDSLEQSLSEIGRKNGISTSTVLERMRPNDRRTPDGSTPHP
jgi:hypothetical protein